MQQTGKHLSDTFPIHDGLVQDRRCVYNVTLWCVRLATAALEKHYVLNIKSMYQYPCHSNPV